MGKWVNDKTSMMRECNEAYSRLSLEAKRVGVSVVDQAKAVNGMLLLKVNTLNVWCFINQAQTLRLKFGQWLKCVMCREVPAGHASIK